MNYTKDSNKTKATETRTDPKNIDKSDWTPSRMGDTCRHLQYERDLALTEESAVNMGTLPEYRMKLEI